MKDRLPGNAMDRDMTPAPFPGVGLCRVWLHERGAA